MNMQTLRSVLVFAFVVVVVGLVLKYAFNKPEYFAVSSCEATDKPYTLIFFYMERCGHCKEFRPTWQQFTELVKSGKAATKKVCLAEMSSEQDAIVRAYNITGFPTVLLVNNTRGTSKTFNGPRTVEGLNTFVLDNAK